jgi:sulfur transfer protein SufE
MSTNVAERPDTVIINLNTMAYIPPAKGTAAYNEAWRKKAAAFGGDIGAAMEAERAGYGPGGMSLEDYQSSQINKQLQDLLKDRYTYPIELAKRLRGSDTETKRMREDINKSESALYQTRPQAYASAEFRGMSPAQMEAVISAREAGNKSQLAQLATSLQNRAGTLGEIGSTLTAQRQQRIEGLQSALKALQDRVKAQQEAEQREFDNQIKLANLQISQMKASRSGGGGRGSSTSAKEAEKQAFYASLADAMTALENGDETPEGFTQFFRQNFPTYAIEAEKQFAYLGAPEKGSSQSGGYWRQPNGQGGYNYYYKKTPINRETYGEMVNANRESEYSRS